MDVVASCHPTISMFENGALAIAASSLIFFFGHDNYSSRLRPIVRVSITRLHNRIRRLYEHRNSKTVFSSSLARMMTSCLAIIEFIVFTSISLRSNERKCQEGVRLRSRLRDRRRRNLLDSLGGRTWC